MTARARYARTCSAQGGTRYAHVHARGYICARHYITLASSISANFHLRTLKIFMHHLDISPKRPANFGLSIPIGMEVLIGIGFPNRGGLFYIYRYDD